mmetsp:Transcript_18051/g.50508  ORF Transcript_18051/g.50508 Transcript_18051/m.50508 type:complete len:233 (+) Transcript_18051:1455-2153(+)
MRSLGATAAEAAAACVPCVPPCCCCCWCSAAVPQGHIADGGCSGWELAGAWLRGGSACCISHAASASVLGAPPECAAAEAACWGSCFCTLPSPPATPHTSCSRDTGALVSAAEAEAEVPEVSSRPNGGCGSSAVGSVVDADDAGVGSGGTLARGGVRSTRPGTEHTGARLWLEESAKLELEGQAWRGLERPAPETAGPSCASSDSAAAASGALDMMPARPSELKPALTSACM